MKIECHILQNFPPHNLNRDDTNSPKDCEFGGVRRARISSQCFKRAVRQYFDLNGSFDQDNRAVRTKRIVDQIVERLVSKGKEAAVAAQVVRTLLQGANIKADPVEGQDQTFRTQYLLYLPARKIDQVTAIALEHWDALQSAAAPEVSETASPDADSKKPAQKKSAKKAAQAAEVPKEARQAVTEALRDASRAPEVALFGRMIADEAGWNVDAACQVAHAISTHRVTMEFDFFTAIDDLKSDSETGSDMMGTVQFNSACFYRYAALDTDELLKNLGGPDQLELRDAAVKAFLEAFAIARPSGKQNSMAANTLPSFVLFTVRKSGQPLSLANAFEAPVPATPNGGFVHPSVQALVQHLGKVVRMYPSPMDLHACSTEEGIDWGPVQANVHGSLAQAIEAVSSAVSRGA